MNEQALATVGTLPPELVARGRALVAEMDELAPKMVRLGQEAEILVAEAEARFLAADPQSVALADAVIHTLNDALGLTALREQWFEIRDAWAVAE